MRILSIVLTTCFCLFVAGFSLARASDEVSGGCPPYDDPDQTYDARPIVNAIDTNQDGVMTHEEWKAAGAPEASWNMFMEQDVYDTGYITRYDFINETPPDGVDANCDGYITIWEFLAFADSAAPDDGDDGSSNDDDDEDECKCDCDGTGSSRWPWRLWR